MVYFYDFGEFWVEGGWVYIDNIGRRWNFFEGEFVVLVLKVIIRVEVSMEWFIVYFIKSYNEGRRFIVLGVDG